jgi:threonine dehydrogenase-like Zn-dependent dehydrogenase
MSARKEYAIIITAPEQAELMEVEPNPVPLGPREVAGKTLVTLVSAGTELAGAFQGTNFPRQVGYAAVFEVEETGREVEDIAVGTHVFCMGPHRSYQRVQREKAIPVPAGLTPEEATFARMMCVSMSTLTTTTARPPQKVLVTGLGLVGHLAAKIFTICGYEVIACDPLEMRRDYASRAGIRTVLPSIPVDDPAIMGHIALVLECSGHEQAVLDGCRVVQKRGEVVLIGTPWKRHTELYAHELTHAIFHRYVVLRSGWEWELPLYPTDFRTNSIYGNLTAAMQWLAERRLLVDNLYSTVSPRHAQRVYQDLLHRRWDSLGAVFDWRDGP